MYTDSRRLRRLDDRDLLAAPPLYVAALILDRQDKRDGAR